MYGIWTGLCSIIEDYSTLGRCYQGWNIHVREGDLTRASIINKDSHKSTMIMKVDDLITSDPRLSVRDVEIALHIDSTTVYRILAKDLDIRELILQMDNVRPHSAARTQDYLKGTGATILSQSAHSPDLNLCDRFLFSHLQQHCRGLEYLDGDELYHDIQHPAN